MDFREAFANELNKSKNKLVENKKLIKESSVIEEDTEETLEPRFDSRNSFYGKAKVVKKDNGDEELYSYNTLVGGIRDGKPYSKGKFSQTTSRHQKEYFTQKGFDPKKVDVEESKKLQEEVSDEAYAIADEIAEKAQGSGMSLDEFRAALEAAASKYPNVKDLDELETDVRGILSYKGIDTNFESGDLVVESSKLEERDRSRGGCLHVINDTVIPELTFVINNLEAIDEKTEGFINLLEDTKANLAHGLGELGYYGK